MGAIGHTAGGSAKLHCPEAEAPHRVCTLNVPAGTKATARLHTPCANLDLAVMRAGHCRTGTSSVFPHRSIDASGGDYLVVSAHSADGVFQLTLDCEPEP
jgi:hypothetical protein